MSDGEKNTRRRDQEFIDDTPTKQEMISTWDKGWQTLFTAIDQLNEQDLLKDIFIRGEAHTVIEAIERQMSHYSYHIGQIVYIGKQIRGKEWNSLSIPKGKSEEYMKHISERQRKSE